VHAIAKNGHFKSRRPAREVPRTQPIPLHAARNRCGMMVISLVLVAASSYSYRCTFGPGLMGRPEARKKKARPRHGTARNNLVPGRHDPLYRAGFGPRSRPMDGHGHGPFKAGTKWPI
jgi:hypothetical protein